MFSDKDFLLAFLIPISIILFVGVLIGIGLGYAMAT